MTHWKAFGCLFTIAAMGVLGCSQEGPKPATQTVNKPVKPTADAKATDGKPGGGGETTASTKKVYRPPQTAAPAVSGPKPTIQLPVELADDLPAVMPKVLLTAGHAATCLVKVGDKLPEADLPDVDGKNRKLSQLFGEEFTVVVFWKHGLPTAREELSDVGPQIVAAYGNRGVRVIGVCVGGTLQQARKDAQELGVNFPILVDTKGDFFARVATDKLPRTYLLDSTGKIVWFDLEYSRTTRRELQQALRFLLPKDATAARSTSG